MSTDKPSDKESIDTDDTTADDTVRRIMSAHVDTLADKALYGFKEAEDPDEIAEVFREVEEEAALLADMVEAVTQENDS